MTNTMAPSTCVAPYTVVRRLQAGSGAAFDQDNAHCLVNDFEGGWWVIPCDKSREWESALTRSNPELSFVAPDWALKLESPHDIEFTNFRVLGQ